MNSLIIFGAKYLIVVLVLLTLAYVAKQSREKQKQLAVFAVITLPVIFVIAKLSSLLYYDPRPFVVGNFTPLISHIPDNGFPSDHTLLSSAVASVVYFFNKKVGTILFVLALLVGLSRVLAGVHHSIDIVGSFVIAFLVSLFVYRWIFPIALESKLYRKLQK